MKTYAFYKTTSFSDYFESDFQTQLITAGDKRKEPITIKYTDSKKGSYDIFSVYYEEKVDREGYYYDVSEGPREFSYYFVKNKFDALYEKSRNIVFFETSYKITDKMLKDISAFPNSKKPNKRNNKIQVEKFEIDLKKVIEKNKHIIGAWFSDIADDPHLKSTNVNGNEVNESRAFVMFENSGKLKSLNVVLNINGSSYVCIISKNGSFSVLSKIPDTSTEILLLNELYDTILT